MRKVKAWRKKKGERGGGGGGDSTFQEKKSNLRASCADSMLRHIRNECQCIKPVLCQREKGKLFGLHLSTQSPHQTPHNLG